MMERSIKAPGSPSSPLQTMYFTSETFLRTLSHLRPAGKPPPPRPRRPESEISRQMASSVMSNRAFSEGAVAVLGDVLLQILGIAGTAALEHHPVLLLIKGDILLTGVGYAVLVVGPGAR